MMCSSSNPHMNCWFFTDDRVELKALGTVLKVAAHSFRVPMRYSSLFSNHWQLGSQNWQDASSTKKDYILIRFIGQSAVAMATQLVINQH